MIKTFCPSVLLISLFVIGCSPGQEKIISITGFAQGSTYSIKYAGRPKYNNDTIRSQVAQILRSIDMSLSVYYDSSIISRINRNEDVRTDTLFNEVFRAAMKISEMSDGAFDITVMPLVKAWGFGPDKHKTFKPSKLDSLRSLVGFRKVKLLGNTLVKSNPDISIDVNAIAQGFTVDIICRYFDRLKIQNYLVEVGGEVRAKGLKNGEKWRIGIDRPIDGNMIPGDDLQAIIKLSNKAIATSGNYRKYYVENGIKYSHHIDPKTGYPTKNRVLSVSVVANDCTTADGLGTAFIVMGLEKSIAFIENSRDLEGYIIYSDEKGNFLTWMSDGLKSLIEEETATSVN
ncbi:MAG TPA: FAD:protein FMN transferase [Bacteroidales bacterium]|nr:FAD:protein FMN transferase [Bacteroidales bacterium]